MTTDELAQFVQANEIYLLTPGMVEWQEEGCYTAYKNYTNPNGFVLQEDKNPVRALIKLHDELLQIKEKP